MCKEFDRYIITLMENSPSSNFTKDIFCPFVPDEMVVKNVVYTATNTETSFAIHSSLVDNIIGVAWDGLSTHRTTEFDIYRAIHGTFDFQLLDAAGLDTETRLGKLYITLEFRSYK